ncbi:MAG: non-canonical purine NTP pyrophosphatase [Bacteroidetes bacterium GWD2_45_23]|nr:MAG: non-canonical purine NTP pyrophosphatase [Bacteroidetes bacterium GWC2_46_850]OFX82939.1 MAG: non-canonical purine NTP pyrophosphatase [Bacteroidetes bacterium GWD2_45_23]HAR37645.1 non-canonical purine NTP pyrophosphatase [Porphyromonadaceae bacterium]HBA99923.1 non-canonical purine NTP pyrophosphatase [Porphyromonadaceae bacterium]HCC17986.1 non-canonical purine NTP pyrophosphatase [Porphyromonadaceae bacterium]
MKKIVFATNNKHKLDEIRKITDGSLQILGLADIHCEDEIEETGTTLEENALLKARYVKEKYGYDCFADDTGLEVEALGGAPGVYSSRYAGEACNPADNMAKLLHELAGVKNRNARFRTVITLLIGDEMHFFEGVVNGRIIEEQRGEAGFGYDPVFVPEGKDQTFAELGNDVKNQISHRALATHQLAQFLTER